MMETLDYMQDQEKRFVFRFSTMVRHGRISGVDWLALAVAISMLQHAQISTGKLQCQEGSTSSKVPQDTTYCIL